MNLNERKYVIQGNEAKKLFYLKFQQDPVGFIKVLHIKDATLFSSQVTARGWLLHAKRLNQSVKLLIMSF